jgi:hypothetical protein
MLVPGLLIGDGQQGGSFELGAIDAEAGFWLLSTVPW